MSLLTLVILLALVGFVCWLIMQIPMPAPFQRIMLGVICLFLVLWLLQQFGLIGGNLRLR